MTVPYLLRLLCLSMASFFLVNAVAGLAASFVSRRAIRFAETMRPRSAARFLFTLRLLPLVLGAGAVLGLCIPSYFWLEPEGTPERVGFACLALVVLGAASWSVSVARIARAFAASVRCNRLWRQAGQEACLPGEISKVTIVEKETPLLALAGVLRPRLVVSRCVLGALSAEQLDVVLYHENAHCTSHDNLKRLFLLLAPDPIPFVFGFSRIERAWAKFTEWAADDEAARGDSQRALTLAAALLRVARMGAGPRLSFLHTSLVAGSDDLSARVDRLLCLEPARPQSPPLAHFFMRGAALLMAGTVAVLMILPATLSSVHQLLELFLH